MATEKTVTGPTPGRRLPPTLDAAAEVIDAFHAQLLADKTKTKSDMRVIEHLREGWPYSTLDRAKEQLHALAQEMDYQGDEAILDRAYSFYRDWLGFHPKAQ